MASAGVMAGIGALTGGLEAYQRQIQTDMLEESELRRTENLNRLSRENKRLSSGSGRVDQNGRELSVEEAGKDSSGTSAMHDYMQTKAIEEQSALAKAQRKDYASQGAVADRGLRLEEEIDRATKVASATVASTLAAKASPESQAFMDTIAAGELKRAKKLAKQETVKQLSKIGIWDSKRKQKDGISIGESLGYEGDELLNFAKQWVKEGERTPTQKQLNIAIDNDEVYDNLRPRWQKSVDEAIIMIDESNVDKQAPNISVDNKKKIITEEMQESMRAEAKRNPEVVKAIINGKRPAFKDVTLSKDQYKDPDVLKFLKSLLPTFFTPSALQGK